MLTLSTRNRALLASALCVCLWGCQGMTGARTPAADPNAADPALPAVGASPPVVFALGEEVELFDGATLGMWKPDGARTGDAVRVEAGAIHLAWGSPGTSVAWSGTQVPASYELALEMMRADSSASGYWFLTFPIEADRTCTLTLADFMVFLCGSSGPEGHGAISREIGLGSETWHSIRVRVADGRVEAIVDGEELQVEMAEAPAALISEDGSPASLEIATWAMSAAVREIRLKRLSD